MGAPSTLFLLMPSPQLREDFVDLAERNPAYLLACSRVRVSLKSRFRQAVLLCPTVSAATSTIWFSPLQLLDSPTTKRPWSKTILLGFTVSQMASAVSDSSQLVPVIGTIRNNFSRNLNSGAAEEEPQQRP